MADFVQTMKDWRRMCQHMEKIGGDKSCDIFPLGGCNEIYEDEWNTDYAEIEEKVAAWAAENPEPVYPTWWEYLTRIHVISPAMGDFQKCVDDLATTPIPADIAQRFGIEPKEG